MPSLEDLSAHPKPIAPEDFLAMREGELELAVEWHSPDLGLRTVRALREAVASAPALEAADELLEELVAFEQQLNMAGERGIRFHFTTDGI